MNHFTRRGFVSHSLYSAAVLYVGLGARSRAAATLSASKRAVDFSQVTFTDGFWSPKQQKIATATLSACIYQTEQKSGRIRNFEKAARRAGEDHEGIYFDDSDVYKALEAMAYSLKNHADAALEAKADEWIGKIAKAQLSDGYINTYFTLKGLDGRWTDMEKHEDYCGGHLIEAGIAYFQTTGKRTLLDAGIRFANHLDLAFRVANRHWVSGHEEIELALVKLYGLTGERRYLTLAHWYLEQRGHGYGQGDLWGNGKNADYCQDLVPVKDQRRIVGHAVRAMYLYSGVADVSAATGDSSYWDTLNAIWEDVVSRNLYVTGGIGSSGRNEGFTAEYDLPNEQAYCETCASVGMVFWNHRMALLTGEGKYIDVLERSLYNAALDGLSLSGDHFFYGNPVASSARAGAKGRSEWFGTACCPSNIARLVSSLGGYLYTASAQNLWINLYAANRTRFKMGGIEVALEVATEYPWDGKIRIALDPTERRRFGLRLRLPGWARSEAVPGTLYSFLPRNAERIEVRLNGKPANYREEKGYAVIEREWRAGDVVELSLPMPARRLVARTEVAAARNCIALQRGPFVYCAEGTDNGGHAWDFTVPNSAAVEAHVARVLNEQIVALSMPASFLKVSADGSRVEHETGTLTAIPYYTWANRNNFDMRVWLPTQIEEVTINA